MGRSLDDLLSTWEERRARGEAVSAAALCPDSPSDAAELERNIRRLEALDKVLGVTDEEPDGAPSSAALPAQVAGYEVRGELGHGGMGIVYRAWDPALRRDVALKMLCPAEPGLRPTEANHLARRFQQEAQVLAQLKHQAIVPIYEAKLHQGRPYFVMECVAGGNLATHRAALTAAGPKAIVPLLEAVARAVQYAHGHGVLHRDLKPANILLGPDRRPLVSDFGLAKLLDVTEPAEADTQPGADAPVPDELAFDEAPTRLTAAGQQPGTPAYMAPEQFDAAVGPIGPATDVWALGVILYELLTGQKPFPCRTREGLCEQVCRGEPVRPRAVRPRLARRLEAVVLRCLAKSPRQRYPSAGALAEALAACRRRRRWPRLAAAAVVLAALTAAVLLAWPRRNDPEPDHRANDPEQDYRAKVAEVQRRLQEQGKVELLPSDPEQPPAFMLRSGQGGEVVTPIPGGLTIHAPSPYCLIELLPEVRAPGYRIRARLRREKPLITEVAKWGVYCQHSTVVTTQGQQHYFNAAYCSGFDEWKKTPPPPVYTIRASLCPRLFGELRHAADRPFREFAGIDTARTFHQDIKYLPRPDTPWSDVEVTVVGDLITATCRVDGGDPVADKLRITPKDQKSIKTAVLALFPDFAGVPREQLAGTALGIYISHAVCTVESFVVETINDP